MDALARDAYAALALLDGRKLPPDVKTAAELLATVVGQDLEQTDLPRLLEHRHLHAGGDVDRAAGEAAAGGDEGDAVRAPPED